MAARVEMVAKIIVSGFVHGKHAYLRSHWNKLDFFVVLCGYIDLIPGVPINTSALRSARVLRPLRAFEFFDGMRVRPAARAPTRPRRLCCHADPPVLASR